MSIDDERLWLIETKYSFGLSLDQAVRLEQLNLAIEAETPRYGTKDWAMLEQLNRQVEAEDPAVELVWGWSSDWAAKLIRKWSGG